jgi:hypothetical protein
MYRQAYLPIRFKPIPNIVSGFLFNFEKVQIAWSGLNDNCNKTQNSQFRYPRT